MHRHRHLWSSGLLCLVLATSPAASGLARAALAPDAVVAAVQACSGSFRPDDARRVAERLAAWRRMPDTPPIAEVLGDLQPQLGAAPGIWRTFLACVGQMSDLLAKR